MFRPASILSTLTILLAAAFAQAADQPQIPTQKIVGADEPVPAGEIVVLQPSSIDQPPAGLLSVSYGWVVIEQGQNGVQVKKRVKAEADGSIIFGAGLTTKKFLVIMSVDYVFEKAPAEKAGDHAQVIQAHRLITAEVSVTNGQPTPTPTPTPTPAPLPDGRFKLASQVNQFVLSKVNLPAAQRTKSAQAMAAAMREIVVAINNGQLKTPNDVIKQTKSANNNAIKQAGVDPTAWDAYSLELKRVLTSLLSQKLLVTVSDYAQCWSEIATGLEAIR